VANGWAQLASMPQPCISGAAGVIDSKLYVLCGYDANGEAKELDVYDPVSNTWTAKASSLVSHANFPASAVINGNFYVAGGDPGLAGTTEMYSPGTNAWKKLRNMTTPVTYTSGTELDGRLYAFGGTPSGGSPIAIVQAFDPITNHWKKVSPSSPVSLSTQDVEVVYGEVFVSGGGSSNGIVGTNESLIVTPSIPEDFVG
jgi:N-acetylneuraminic acid mutarotase